MSDEPERETRVILLVATVAVEADGIGLMLDLTVALGKFFPARCRIKGHENN
jgi:hypothetical protein